MAVYLWINGYPAVGKLTIARALQEMLPNSDLIDNHSLIDVVKLPRDHPEYNSQREQVRQEAFDRFVHPSTDEQSACGSRDAQMKRVVIFTGKHWRCIIIVAIALMTCSVDFLTNGKLGTTWSTAHKIAADKAGRPFLPIYLRCEREENLSRLLSPERVRDGKQKLVDKEVVSDFLDRLVPYSFPGLGVEIDTTGLRPEEAAGKILMIIKEHENGG